MYHHYLRRLASVSITASLTTICAFAGSSSPNLPNFHKIDDHVYRGAQPTDDGFKEMAKLGIKTVIDLRQIGEHSQANEEKLVTSLGMRYISIPMKGLSRPDDIAVENVFSLLNDGTTGPVFVHCKRGADRTGLVIAVYRMAHNHWDNKTALKEAKDDGMSIFERAIQHYISDYKPTPAPISPNAPIVAAAEVHTAAQ